MMLKAPFLLKIRIFFSVPENLLNVIFPLLLLQVIGASARTFSPPTFLHMMKR